MGIKGVVPMGLNYILAEKISRIFIDGTPEKELAEIGWVWGNSAESITLDIFEKNPQIPLVPQKRTMLHHFIGCFLTIYLEYENYNYIDQCYINEYPELLEEHFKFLADILLEYQQEVPDYKSVMANLMNMEECYEPIVFINDDGVKVIRNTAKEMVTKLLNDFMCQIQVIQEEIEDATFFLLFKDKNFLFRFNLFFSSYVQKLDKSYFDTNGAVRRCSYLPHWLKAAIMFRDNGCCQLCGKNLTGSFDSVDMFDVHFDHIISLYKYGTNDPTNFQLLCQHCNESKGIKVVMPQYRYVLPWAMSNLDK